jgi:hypothetical protein
MMVGRDREVRERAVPFESSGSEEFVRLAVG